MSFAKSLGEIVKGCIRCNSAAQRQLYELFAPKMMAVCYRYAKDRDEAEDILQEGFIKVFQNLNKYENNGSLEGWIRRIIVNTAIDLIRKQKQMPLVELDEHVGASGLESEGDALGSLGLEYLMQLIQDLPPGYRLVFNMYAVEGYSHAEIAAELGINESSSRSQYTRAKSMLKKRIETDFLVVRES